MCTASWRYRPAGYEIFFSRDEQRSRPLGEAPKRHSHDELSWLAPRDPQGGGSWIVANSHGLTTCVLNAWENPSVSRHLRPTKSRGLIPLSLAPATGLDCATKILERSLIPKACAPCFILCLVPASAALWIWNGAALHPMSGSIHPPLTTSSHDSANVTHARREAFRRLSRSCDEITSEQLRLFHECPGQIADATTVRMSRPDARTVSLIRVILDLGAIRMTYAERDGDDGFRPEVETFLPRALPQREDLACRAY